MMTKPQLQAIKPAFGPSSGGDLVRLLGAHFAYNIGVFFDDTPGSIVTLRHEGDISIADIRTPSHAPGHVNVTVRNLAPDGNVIPGEETTRPAFYQFERIQLIQESILTSLVRRLLDKLKKSVMATARMSVAVDYRHAAIEGTEIIALAELPSLVLTGPRIYENRFYSSNVPIEQVFYEEAEMLRRRPALTVDLEFTLTGASDRTVELLNLLAATTTFLNRNKWIDMHRNPANSSSELVRWEMDMQGELRTQFDPTHDLRAFRCGLIIRGFDLDEGLPLDRSHLVETPQLETTPLTDEVSEPEEVLTS